MNKYAIKLKDNENMDFRLPKRIRVTQMQSKLPNITSEKNLRELIYNSIENSEGYSIKEFLDLSQPIIIIVDDHTRKTPTLPAIEILYKKLKQIGVKDDQISILVSSGTHRKMKKEELYARIGKLLDILNVVQHDCYDTENLFFAGNIDGIPIFLNKLLQQKANVIGIGSIVAHKFSGWSGGGKIVCPGVTGYKTILLSHKKAIMEEQIIPGQHNNWFRTFINKVSRIAGLKYLINFIPGIDGVFGLLAGEPDLVHNKGIKVAKKNLTYLFEDRFDIAIISAYPATNDLWQGGKGFYLGDMVVKVGGTIILVTPLDEGKGDHPDFLSMLDKDSVQIKNLIDKNKISDPLAAVAAYAVRNINEHCTLRIVSPNSAIQHKMILNHEIADDFQKVFDESLNEDVNNIAIINDIYLLPEKIVKNQCNK